ncbi:MAG: hypothetical protein ACLGIO_13440 [Acidimicrobiia bacterium]
MAGMQERVRRGGAGAPAWSRWARRAGASVVAAVVAAALAGPAPVRAQLPELLPTSTTAPTTTTAPRPSESTLLPPLEELAPPTTGAPGGTTTTGVLTLPAPGPTAAPGPQSSRTTTFDTLPVPPRTRARVTTTTLQGSVQPSTLPVVEDQEGGDEEGGFAGTLPFTEEDEVIQAAGLDRELGAEDGEDPITAAASVAAGLLALVLLGVVGWLQSQVRGRPHLW